MEKKNNNFSHNRGEKLWLGNHYTLTVYFYRHRLFSKSTHSGQLSISPKYPGCTSSSSSMDRSTWVSISSEVEWVTVICPFWMHTHGSTVHLTLYLVRLIIELSSLKQTSSHRAKPKQHQLSYVELSWYIFSCFFSLFPVKHLEILSWVTVINIACSWYLFSCGQLNTRRILHLSCQRKFMIGDDNAWKKRVSIQYVSKTVSESLVKSEKHGETTPRRERDHNISAVGFDKTYDQNQWLSDYFTGFWDFIFTVWLILFQHYPWEVKDTPTPCKALSCTVILLIMGVN